MNQQNPLPITAEVDYPKNLCLKYSPPNLQIGLGNQRCNVILEFTPHAGRDWKLELEVGHMTCAEAIFAFLDLVVQTGMCIAAVIAGFFAKRAFDVQDETLRRLISEDQKKTSRERIAASPFLEFDILAARRAHQLIVGGKSISPINLLFSPKVSTLQSRFAAQPNGSQTVDLLLVNRRPVNSIMSIRAESDTFPTDASFNDPFRTTVAELNGAAIHGDHWIFRYKITKRAFDVPTRVRIALQFETVAGHSDIHTYEHLLGHSEWKRIDPRSI